MLTSLEEERSLKPMQVRAGRNVAILVAAMGALVLIVDAVAVSLLYRTGLEEEHRRLTEIVTSQAALIDAMARFDALYSHDYPLGPAEATLTQLRDAHQHYAGMGETGEFTLARLEGNEIVFLLTHRHGGLEERPPIALGSHLAQPMQLALAGQSGTVVGLDYRGVRVLAAYHPVTELGLGIVAKIDLAEIRRPFARAAVICAVIGLLLALAGALLVVRLTAPLVQDLVSSLHEREQALDQVKQLRGLLPICASCKRIRDDQGSWRQIEIYIRDRSEAQFSHGICPECTKELYAELDVPSGG